MATKKRCRPWQNASSVKNIPEDPKISLYIYFSYMYNIYIYIYIRNNHKCVGLPKPTKQNYILENSGFLNHLFTGWFSFLVSIPFDHHSLHPKPSSHLLDQLLTLKVFLWQSLNFILHPGMFHQSHACMELYRRLFPQNNFQKPCICIEDPFMSLLFLETCMQLWHATSKNKCVFQSET